ncbi:MAG TPA: hypothetical protein VFW30_07200, partial [Bryocella sp.]|nr:hypothetical protein [Bryocella sp.]
MNNGPLRESICSAKVVQTQTIIAHQPPEETILMFRQRAYLRKLQRASTIELAQMLLTRDISEQNFLRLYFGTERYARIRDHAATARRRFELDEPALGTVVVLPGILGSELVEGNQTIWLDVWSIICGEFDQFPLNSDGTSVEDINAPELVPPILFQNYYGEIQARLAADGWRVVPFPYDWRLDIAASARSLKEAIDRSVASDQPLRFVAHSMGGLVVRSLLNQHLELRNRLARFIMLGTPNFGSFAIPLLYNGLDGTLNAISIADQWHDMNALLAIAKTFVGTYQMQPFLGASEDAGRLFEPASYGDLNPPVDRFVAAKAFQTDVGGSLPLPPESCNYIAGFNQNTVCGVCDWNHLRSMDGYRMT